MASMPVRSASTISSAGCIAVSIRSVTDLLTSIDPTHDSAAPIAFFFDAQPSIQSTLSSAWNCIIPVHVFCPMQSSPILLNLMHGLKVMSPLEFDTGSVVSSPFSGFFPTLLPCLAPMPCSHALTPLSPSDACMHDPTTGPPLLPSLCGYCPGPRLPLMHACMTPPEQQNPPPQIVCRLCSLVMSPLQSHTGTAPLTALVANLGDNFVDEVEKGNVSVDEMNNVGFFFIGKQVGVYMGGGAGEANHSLGILYTTPRVWWNGPEGRVQGVQVARVSALQGHHTLDAPLRASSPCLPTPLSFSLLSTHLPLRPLSAPSSGVHPAA